MDIPATLQAIIEQLNQEWVHLQIVGRQLTPEEEQRSTTLAQTLEHLRIALALLTDDAPTELDVPGAGL